MTRDGRDQSWMRAQRPRDGAAAYPHDGAREAHTDPDGYGAREWSSPGIARVAELIRERTGLVFPASRAADVEGAIDRSMRRRGLKDASAFAELLDHDSRVRDAIVAELTIGETYFYRDPAQFGLLREHLLPALLAARSDRPVRVWSAGCASGEEPYSIAMLLDELDQRGRADITGTDISRPRLEDAQRAIYSRWSLRALPVEQQQRWFTPRGRYYELRPHIRAAVDFRYLNLAEDRFPSLSAGIWGMDVILCRNVLIYFDGATVESVARRLVASLSEDGYLILGASDPPIAEMVECDVVVTDAGLLYRRPGAGPGAAPGPAVRAERATSPAVDEGLPEPLPPEPPRDVPPDVPPEPPTVHIAAAAAPVPPPPAVPVTPASERHSGAPEVAATLEAAYARRDFDAVRAIASRAAEAGHLDERGWSWWLRALANQGCLDEAALVADRAVHANGPTAELLYLTAVLQLQAGAPVAAAATARRALYLDRGLVVAHLTHAEAQRQLGSVEGARRSLRNAGTLLSALAADEVVPASDGESAGRLAELVRTKLRLIGDAQ